MLLSDFSKLTGEEAANPSEEDKDENPLPKVTAPLEDDFKASDAEKL